MKKSLFIAPCAIIILFVVGIFLINSRVENGKGTHEEVASGTIIDSNDENFLDLSNFEENITITKPGTYIVQGSFQNSIIVEAEGKVQLAFNNVEIFSNRTAAIINKTSNPLEIALIQDTTNQISGGSNLKYKSAIYSVGELTISGDMGGIIIYSRLANNSPIFSEDKINITSGVVLLTGREDILRDNMNFFENKISFQLKKDLNTGTQVMILNNEGDPISQFESKGIFSKMIFTGSFVEKDKKYFIYGNEELLVSGVAE